MKVNLSHLLQVESWAVHTRSIRSEDSTELFVQEPGVVYVAPDLVVLGIPVGSLGVTLDILVLSLDITLQVLGGTFDGVIVVDGLVNDDCANSGSDSEQYLQQASKVQSSEQQAMAPLLYSVLQAHCNP